MAALDPTINFGKVTVNQGYSAGATTVVLQTGDGAKLPATFSYNVVWWDSTLYADPTDDPNVEIVRVTNRSSDTLTVTRAQESTSASTKNTTDSTYMMILAPTKKMIDDIDTHVKDTNDEHSQYVKLAGRSGGQTVQGDTAASGDLTLESTSHTTKGDIILTSSAILNQESNPTAKDSTTGGSAPIDIQVINGYAYVVSQIDSKLSIFDVSNPNDIIAKDTITTGLSIPTSIIVAGKYAYITDNDTDVIAIFDISDPTAIVAKDTIAFVDGIDLSVCGNFLYAIRSTNNELAIFDISNPDNIQARDTITTGLASPRKLFVLDRYAYIINDTDDLLLIFDVGDPDNIIAKDTITTGLANGPRGVYVVDRYAYVTGADGDKLSIFDVSDPTAIVAKDTISTNLNRPITVIVSGRYAYVGNTTGNTLAVFDISDPALIVAKGTIGSMTGIQGFDIAGKHIYAVLFGSDLLSIVELASLDIPTMECGSAKVNNLQVLNEVDLSGTVNINTGLTVKRTSNFNDTVSVTGNVNFYSGHIRRSVTAGLTASTTQTQGQQPLTTDINEISVSANIDDTVTMPNAVAGMQITIINNGANRIQIFPASGDDLGSGVNTAVTLASATKITYCAYDSTNWSTI